MRVVPVLYRRLLHSAYRIERLARPGHMPHISEHLMLSAVGGHNSDIRTDQLLRQSIAVTDVDLVNLVRRKFREGSSESDDARLGRALDSVRSASEVLQWLQASVQLTELAQCGSSELEGAVFIEQLIRKRSLGCDEPEAEAEAASRLKVEHPWDATAHTDTVRAKLRSIPWPAPLPDPDTTTTTTTTSTRLHKLAVLNRAVLEFLRPESDADEVEAASCIEQVLQRRRGLPITLCIAYQAVAQETFGLRLELTNFPGRVLLRLPPVTAVSPDGSSYGHSQADEAEAAAATLAVEAAVSTVAAEAAVANVGFGVEEHFGRLCGLWQCEYGGHGHQVDTTLPVRVLKLCCVVRAIYFGAVLLCTSR